MIFHAYIFIMQTYGRIYFVASLIIHKCVKKQHYTNNISISFSVGLKTSQKL
jgi:hypothetical protein